MHHPTRYDIVVTKGQVPEVIKDQVSGDLWYDGKKEKSFLLKLDYNR